MAELPGGKAPRRAREIAAAPLRPARPWLYQEMQVHLRKNAPVTRWRDRGGGCSQRLVRQDYPRLGSELDFNINAAGQVKLHQCVDGLCRRAVDIDDAPMGTGFEVLAGVFVDVGRAQHAVDLALGWERNGADRRCGGVVGSFDDFFAGEIQHAAVKRLQADADLLLSNSGGHGSSGRGQHGPALLGYERAG